jgi:D-cysteine desulfhydrase
LRRSGRVARLATRELPIVERFPALASIPRVSLGRFPTPVAALPKLAPTLSIKRDDLSADPIGGNKPRALEFLLGTVTKDSRVVTVGSAGSTHALAVATYAKRLGAHVSIGRWQQEMNEAATRVSERIDRVADDSPIFRNVAAAYLWATTRRWRGDIWIPAGGSSPLGTLGHVNAALELADQIRAGRVEQPMQVVVPLGTGGTMAGLALGFAIAELPITIIGARVVSKLIARRGHVLGLARRTRTLIEHTTGAHVPRVSGDSIVIHHETYGGAYGRETPEGRNAAERLASAAHLVLDPTYSAKTFALALEVAARGPTLFWLTFDSRTLDATSP